MQLFLASNSNHFSILIHVAESKKSKMVLICLYYKAQKTICKMGGWGNTNAPNNV